MKGGCCLPRLWRRRYRFLSFIHSLTCSTFLSWSTAISSLVIHWFKWSVLFFMAISISCIACNSFECRLRKKGG
ncbi:MAG: hypothetical protein JOS17DRAFT_726875 [Linnemannia elongata]|nr:MAG: hypothetical protein JOS17DRAFT_726875 [Linnemannia elongata]